MQILKFFRPRRRVISELIATMLMVGITVALAGVLTLYMQPMCGGPYSAPTNSSVYFKIDGSGNERVLTVLYVYGGGGEDFYLNRSVVQIICGNSHNVVVQFPSNGTGIGEGDVKHFEFYNLDNDGTYDPGDYFIVHICDNVHMGDIFRVLDGNATAGEERLL